MGSKVGVKLNVLAGDAGSRRRQPGPAEDAGGAGMVGRADPDVIKSQFYPKNRNVLLQKGGTSHQGAEFVDQKLNAPAGSRIVPHRSAQAPQGRSRRRPEPPDRPGLVIPIFEEPQVFAGSTVPARAGLRSGGSPQFLPRMARQALPCAAIF
jgi:peptide/nickel transport system substrate-binding protein